MMPCHCSDRQCQEIARLRRRVEELEFLLRYPSLKVAPFAAPFVRLLIERGLVTREAFFTTAFGGLPDCDRPRAPNYFKVVAFYVRRGLADHGITMTTVRGDGYRLEPGEKAKLRGVLGLERRAA